MAHHMSDSQRLLTKTALPPSGRLYSSSVVLEGHQGAVFTAQFNHNGSRIATGGADKLINLWHLPTDANETVPNYGVLTGHNNAVTSLAWISDETIASSSADGSVGIWDTETGKRLRKCQAHDAVVNHVAVSKSDSLLVSVGDDGIVNLWDSREKLPVNSITTNYPILATTFNHRGSSFYVGGIDPVVTAYDIRRLTPIWNSGGQTNTITSLAINNDDSVLLSRSIDGTIITYSAKEFVPDGISRTNPLGYEGAPSGQHYLLIQACFSNDNINILSGSEDSTVTVWDFGTRKLINKFTGHTGSVLGVSYHPTEKIVVSTSSDGKVIVREV